MCCKTQYMTDMSQRMIGVMASDRLTFDDRPNVCTIRMRSVLARSQRVGAHVFSYGCRWRDIVWTYHASIFNEWMNACEHLYSDYYTKKEWMSLKFFGPTQKRCVFGVTFLRIAVVEWHRSRNFSEGHNTVMKWTLQQQHQQQHREARAFFSVEW